MDDGLGNIEELGIHDDVYDEDVVGK